MNIFILIMLAFSCLGLLDKLLGARWGFAPSFDRGLSTMGSMAMAIVGVCCVGVEFIQRNTDAILKMTESMPFDASFLIGCILAPDMGGYFIAEQLSSSRDVLILNGIILASVLGQTITFQIPVFLESVDREDHPAVIKGFIVGIIMAPVGVLIAGILLKMEIGLLMVHFVPLLIICLLLAAGLIKFPGRLIRVFAVFARGIQWIIGITFFFTIIGVFVPSLAYTDMESVHEAVTILFKCAIIIGGSLVLSEIILKLFRARLQKLAIRIGINEVSIISFLMNFSTSLAILPLYPKMDEKGKMMNAAFGVSGAYVLGGQFAFISSVSDGYTVTVFMVSKVLCGVLSAFVMSRIYDRGR